MARLSAKLSTGTREEFAYQGSAAAGLRRCLHPDQDNAENQEARASQAHEARGLHGHAEQPPMVEGERGQHLAGDARSSKRMRHDWQASRYDNKEPAPRTN